ncbi:3-dehydroquinate synthase, partial [Maribacter arcticus]|nr:3-dehydroquinate synthase [Maribacter arcticus]
MQLQPIKQSFKVQYDYQLYFTSGLFALENPLFEKLISDYKEFEPVKLLFVLDNGVKNHHPKLIQQIKSYCESNEDNLKYTDTIVLQ